MTYLRNIEIYYFTKDSLIILCLQDYYDLRKLTKIFLSLRGCVTIKILFFLSNRNRSCF